MLNYAHNFFVSRSGLDFPTLEVKEIRICSVELAIQTTSSIDTAFARKAEGTTSHLEDSW